MKVSWQSNSNELEYEIWSWKGKILSFSCTLCWLPFMFFDCPSMPPCQLQPYLHITRKPSMSHEKLKIYKTKKFEFETYEKSPNLTTRCNFPNLNPFFSLIWEHFSLSLLVSSPHDLETHLKIPKNCLIWEKRTINPKLQLACFSLVHIKVQWNGAFHLTNVRLKDDFKRCICDCEFTTTVRTGMERWNPKYWLREQDISSCHWVVFCPNPKLKSGGK